MLRYAALQAEALEVQNARDALFFSLGHLAGIKNSGHPLSRIRIVGVPVLFGPV
jgi:hypothetical protein